MAQEQHFLLTPEATRFLSELHRKFETNRQVLLTDRRELQQKLDRGWRPKARPETAEIRQSNWFAAPPPIDLQDRRVEITGPAESKMMINALNSGAKVFMADLEDSLSPSWSNILAGQEALFQAVRRNLTYETTERRYSLKSQIATLIVRPRGWHLDETHFKVQGEPISASLFDFGLFAFHNALELLKRGSGPYFYLPKIENHLEARLWSQVFEFAEGYLGLAPRSIRATVLIETILAAFDMDEIIFELKERIVGLNAGRWDYIFSLIKKFHADSSFILPQRSDVTMSVPFMEAYCNRLVTICHRRGIHAMGGMSAFIPNRRDPEVNRVALEKVEEDKRREASQGFDGTWVAHPDLVPVALQVFDSVLGTLPNQKHRAGHPLASEQDLIQVQLPDGRITEAGVRSNIEIALHYIAKWLDGQGAVAIHNLMEDAATAEIARAQLWQWAHHEVSTSTGASLTPGVFKDWLNQEALRLAPLGLRRLDSAIQILEQLVLDDQFAEFLTLMAYEKIEEKGETNERRIPHTKSSPTIADPLV